jgi:parvulin-like peptidyl-prolyl isomerase
LNLKEVSELRNDKIIIRNVREYENSQILKRYLETHIGPQVTVTEKETKDYYQKNLHQFSSPPKVKARHILLRSREDAEKVAALLKNGGDFKELAKQYSIDLPAALEGGTMGIIEKGKGSPDIEKALFTLDIGEISDIVKTRYGYHILTVDEIMTAEFKPFESVRDQIQKFLLRQKETAAFSAMTAKLEQQADIKIFEDRLGEAGP